MTKLCTAAPGCASSKLFLDGRNFKRIDLMGETCVGCGAPGRRQAAFERLEKRESSRRKEQALTEIGSKDNDVSIHRCCT